MATTVNTSDVSVVVCGQRGHHIVLFSETNKYLCIQCGATLEEIRGENKPKKVAA